jgi:hypothetical protein
VRAKREAHKKPRVPLWKKASKFRAKTGFGGLRPLLGFALSRAPAVSGAWCVVSVVFLSRYFPKAEGEVSGISHWPSSWASRYNPSYSRQ